MLARICQKSEAPVVPISTIGPVDAESTRFSVGLSVVALWFICIRAVGIKVPKPVCPVAFFVIFFLLNNFGRKFVKEDVLQPIAGMWMATAVLLPIGFFLIYKALHDSTLFNKEPYFRMFRWIRRRLPARSLPSKKTRPATS